ncbi:MAG TPA: ZIP family metal transporter [Candidatus Magasanikbacteria bacterium]|nr:ZIP family metal transporter [Candidatus Magasanikbacteria bacterium]
MQAIIYSILSVIVVSLISLIGLASISIKEDRLRKILIYLVSFSAGALLADAFIHLLPEAVEETGFTLQISIYILLGIGLSFVMEKIIHWHHCHHTHSHECLEEHHHHVSVAPFAKMNLIGDTVHNFIDGLIIGGSYLVSIPLGLATTFAVILHEIPQEIGDFGILLHGGYSRKKALILNFITGLTAVLGAIIAILVSGFIPHITTFLIPFAAGSFIYIAGSDLVPELHKETNAKKSALQLLISILGVVVMMALLLLE